MGNYHLLIHKAIQACTDKNASIFALLFTEDAEIIFSKNSRLSKKDIEEVTNKYFSTLKYVNIEIHCILIHENKAFIEWSWSDYNLATNTENHRDNVIVLDFKDNLIYRWREYKS